jgi:hypothetical protein
VASRTAGFADGVFCGDGRVRFIFFFGAVEALLPLLEAEDEAIERAAMREAETIVAIRAAVAARPQVRVSARRKESPRIARDERDATEARAGHAGELGENISIRIYERSCSEEHIRRQIIDLTVSVLRRFGVAQPLLAVLRRRAKAKAHRQECLCHPNQRILGEMWRARN